MTAAAPVASEESLVRLRTAVMRLGRWLRTASAEEGLSPAQSSVLATLVREGPMRAGDLAAVEALNPTMVSRVLAHLEEAGLAARAADPGDGRGHPGRGHRGRTPADRAPARPARGAAAGPPGGPSRRPGRRPAGRPAGAGGAGRGRPLIALLPGGTFAALRTPNYRRYFTGQAISMVGTWMQSVGQSWLVLELTHSGTALGLVAAAQFLPVLLLAPYGGLLADRANKRHLLMGTQTVLGLLALTLGLLVVTGAVQLWMVVVLAVLFGLINAVDNPARQSFALEMVGRGRLRNAISLNSVLVNVAAALGPAVAGVLIATVGTGLCFLVNAASFAAVLLALAPDGPEGAAPVASGGAGARAGARGPALRGAHPGPARAPGHAGPHRDAGLRVLGGAAAAGPRHLRRGPGDVRHPRSPRWGPAPSSAGSPPRPGPATACGRCR